MKRWRGSRPCGRPPPLWPQREPMPMVATIFTALTVLGLLIRTVCRATAPPPHLQLSLVEPRTLQPNRLTRNIDAPTYHPAILCGDRFHKIAPPHSIGVHYPRGHNI